MIVLLPRRDYGLERLLGDLNAEYWRQQQMRFSERKGRIVLPRFTVEYEVTLNQALTTMGMRDAFAELQADFSLLWWKPDLPQGAVLDRNVYVNEVLHKTFVQVNEEGTEAAAVTSVKMGLTAYHPPEPPFEMIVDHPFICAIVDNRTGLILFVGAILDPR
jgi:serpin B